MLDSSAAVEYLVDRAHGSWVGDRIADDPDVHGPHLLDLEVVSALRGLVACGALSLAKARLALEDLGELALDRYPHALLVDRIWQLRAHVTVYDAAYIALAEALDATLVTTDIRLSRTHGHRARIVAP